MKILNLCLFKILVSFMYFYSAQIIIKESTTSTFIFCLSSSGISLPYELLIRKKVCFIVDHADNYSYLYRGGPVCVHLSVLMVVTLKLQLQIRPAGGDTTQTIVKRLGGVNKHSSFVFPHMVFFFFFLF